MNKAAKQLDKVVTIFEENFVVVCFAVMLIIVNLEIVYRYILQSPFPWAEESARYLMVWGVYVGISIGVHRSVHLGVDAFVNPLPPKLKTVVKLISALIELMAYIVFAYFALQITASIKGTGQTAPAMGIPMYLAYAALPVGFILSTYRKMQVIWSEFVVIRKEGV